ncbi:D-aminoacyl-tRNA deacylase [Marinobacter sp.]|uniref:D-aminoacyl-tRNA deacylase n=1 Tax=Marinobacter sp. TaxID=50741 RepID=UPI002B4686BB|nr:D-aminoacyl-tRNA deacylase [Marinobacter sp.]HKK56881.1 D-aminoacyl-tRNA deacylase [Marinobacter sp.]
MKGLLQRVSHASVTVAGETIAEIPAGLLLLLAVEKPDDSTTVKTLCRKILGYRVFPDDQGRMNRCLQDINGSLLVVPQFTLAADTRSGSRPGFSRAASPECAQALFHEFVAESQALLGAERVGEGRFGADMKVALVNDGPVTFLLQVGGVAKRG